MPSPDSSLPRGGRSAPSSSASLEQSLADALAGGYVLPWRQPLWVSWSQTSRRADGTWVAGAMIVLILVATLPLSFLCMTILTMAAVATCMRAFALHQYTQRLSELAIHEQADSQYAESDAGSTASSAAGPLSGPATRRPRRPSLLTAVAAAGRPFNLLHLRLSLVDRDFTEPGDYELLLRLDELENGTQQEQQGPPPVPESQLAMLPVHVHRTPTKKGKQTRGPFDTVTPRAGTDDVRSGAQVAPLQSPLGGKPPQGRKPAAAPRPAFIPVLQEQPQQALAAPVACAAGSGCAAPAAPVVHPVVRQPSQEIVPATPVAAAPPPSSESEEDEEILCSVCLEPFDDGAKIVSLPCRHQYHEECVKTWLRYKGFDATCPNCKGVVFTPELAEAAQQARGAHA